MRATTPRRRFEMSFKARRLRVQFPCPPGTVIELGRGGPCHFPTDPCEGGTCWFQSPIVCDFPSPILCEVTTDPCLRFGTCPFSTCWYPTPPCRGTMMASPCPHFTAVGCPPATDVIDPGEGRRRSRAASGSQGGARGPAEGDRGGRAGAQGVRRGCRERRGRKRAASSPTPEPTAPAAPVGIGPTPHAMNGIEGATFRSNPATARATRPTGDA